MSDKKEITTLVGDDVFLRKIRGLRPVSYTSRGKKQFGFIAEEVHKFFPDAVGKVKTKGELLIPVVHVDQLVPACVAAIQALYSLIEERDKVIQDLSKRIKELEGKGLRK